MLVPEAAVNEDHSLLAGKHDVRGAGKVATVVPKEVAQGMEQPADTKLGLGVFSLMLDINSERLRGITERINIYACCGKFAS